MNDLLRRRRAMMSDREDHKAYLYNYGEVGEFTGGFDIPREVWSGYNTFPTIEQDYVQFTGINNINIFLPFKSAIDLSNYKKLVMDVEIESTLDRYSAVRGHVQSQPNTSSSYELVRTPASTPTPLLGRTKIEIDVSEINQSAYIFFATSGSKYYKWKLYRAWLE